MRPINRLNSIYETVNLYESFAGCYRDAPVSLQDRGAYTDLLLASYKYIYLLTYGCGKQRSRGGQEERRRRERRFFLYIYLLTF